MVFQKEGSFFIRRDNSDSNRWASICSFSVTLLVSGILWSGTLRSDLTPFGDGSRIMKWLAFVQNHGDSIPLWNPFRNGGYPLFSDLEHFWYLVPFVKVGSSNANLQLNIALFILLLIPGAIAWIVARRLGLNVYWAAIAAILVCFNEPLILNEQSGRFLGFINRTSLLVVLAILSRRSLDVFSYTMLAVCIGVGLTVAGQYAMIQAIFIFSALLFEHQRDWSRPFLHILNAIGRTAAISLVGFALAAVMLIPLFGHAHDSYVSLEAIRYTPVLLGNALDLSRFILPFAPSSKPIFLSLLVVPAIVIAFTSGVPLELRNWLRKILLPILYTAIFILMCLPLLGPLIAKTYSAIPIISSIRQMGIAIHILALISPFAVAMIFQSCEERRITSFGQRSRIALGVYFALAGTTCAIFGIANSFILASVSAAIVSILLLMMAIYFILAVFTNWNFNYIENIKLSNWALGLGLLSILMLAPTAFVEDNPVRDKPLHVNNKVELPKLYEIVMKDTDGYYQFLKDTGGIWFLHSFRRGGATFSLHFPKGQAYSYSLISEKYNLDKQRPHWLRQLRCHLFSDIALELLAVKYLFCKESDLKEYRPPGFEVVGREDGMVLFRRDNNSDGLLNVFCRWRRSPPTELRRAREQVLNAFTRREVLIDVNDLEPPSDTSCPDVGFAEADIQMLNDKPNELSFMVNSQQAGVLVIPDNFTRGWQATVNGERVTINRVFYVYRGVPVMRGQNQIRLFYIDPYVKIGLYISVVTFGLLVIITLFGLRARFNRHVR